MNKIYYLVLSILIGGTICPVSLLQKGCNFVHEHSKKFKKDVQTIKNVYFTKLVSSDAHSKEARGALVRVGAQGIGVLGIVTVGAVGAGCIVHKMMKQKNDHLAFVTEKLTSMLTPYDLHVDKITQDLTTVSIVINSNPDGMPVLGKGAINDQQRMLAEIIKEACPTVQEMKIIIDGYTFCTWDYALAAQEDECDTKAA